MRTMACADSRGGADAPQPSVATRGLVLVWIAMRASARRTRLDPALRAASNTRMSLALSLTLSLRSACIANACTAAHPECLEVNQAQVGSLLAEERLQPLELGLRRLVAEEDVAQCVGVV